ncbi:zinc ABC transporter ATP-binding protein AztA [Saccharopolyspora cebuensis]|uniref:Zinc ABC transporter ATP-binding protein AztA n=1 Tax=Saccharopolyspora cebuensis TaxID=418759 RepID=A0ABV4CJJ0_9PSEU
MNTDRSAVELHEISAGYRNRPVLHGITAEVPRRGITAIVGPNGSGKSTLLDVVAGVLAPSGGAVRLADRTRPALVPQRSAVSDALPLAVREAVAMGRWSARGPWRRLTRADRAIVDDCLERLDLADLADRQLGALSGGQRQRALVAQGLAQEAGLLLLDEPGAGLDLEAQQRINTVLEDVAARGTTVVHVTHDLAEAVRARHCLLLRDGRLAAAGPPGTALHPELVQEVWGLTLTLS